MFELRDCIGFHCRTIPEHSENSLSSAPMMEWRPEKSNALLVPITSFLGQARAEIDWLIDGLIQRGANGFFCAVPKGGKSWAAADMAISLALGCPWLGFNIPKPTRVALISREDAPQLTAWRVKHLFAGKNTREPNLFETNLYVNTRQQSAELMLDNEEQVSELMDALKQRQIEFAIFDVFNVLHAADENDNTEMRRVLRQLSKIQAEVGCAIGVVHHFNKAEQGSMTQRLRGSSAIAGWAEWLIGISMADEEQKIRRMEFELKAAQPPTATTPSPATAPTSPPAATPTRSHPANTTTRRPGTPTAAPPPTAATTAA